MSISLKVKTLRKKNRTNLFGEEEDEKKNSTQKPSANSHRPIHTYPVN